MTHKVPGVTQSMHLSQIHSLNSRNMHPLNAAHVALGPIERKSMAKNQDGFTLVELMIAFVVIGILTAVALPNYNAWVKKSRRADATVALSKTQQLQEKYRVSNATYSSSMSSIGASSTSDSGYYTISISSANTTDYTLTATPVSGKSQASDTSCSSITIAQSSGNSTYSPAACWSK